MNNIFVIKRGNPSRSFLITAALVAILIGALGPVSFFTSAVMANGDGVVITGYKFYDINGIDGRNDDEPGIDDWGIKLLLPDGEGGVDEVESTETYDGGYYYFGGELDDGTYILCERRESENWTQTYPREDTPGAVSCHGFDDEMDDELAEWGWTLEIEDGALVGDSEDFDFGNITGLGAVNILKFNDLDGNGEHDVGEPGISGWKIRLENAEFDDSFAEQFDDYFTFDGEWRETGPDGRLEWMLPPGNYEFEENERDGWRAITDTSAEVEIRKEDGAITVDPEIIAFGNKPASLTAFKYFDENLGLLVRDWEICLFGLEQDGEWPDCKRTAGNGTVSWQNLLPGIYMLDEEERSGWAHQGFSGIREWEEENQDLGQAVVRLEDGGDISINFLNWIDDHTPPISSFEDPMEHRVIDTEIVSLELSGSSSDLPVVPVEGEEPGFAGVREAELRVRQLAGPEAVGSYPSQSFFDVFTDIRCENPETIPIEIVALNLVSVNPITVTWDTQADLGRYGAGIYCFEVSATDNANNPEHTAIAGPLAYVPVVEISEQTTDTLSESIFTVRWTTNEPATSRVIYDTESHPVLDEAPNYGYAFSTDTFDVEPKVTSHSVAISGLSGGTTYYYRTVSSASPESIGDEDSVTTPSGSDTEDNDSGGGNAEVSVPAANSGGGGGGIVYNSVPNQPFGAPQIGGAGSEESEEEDAGLILGKETTSEEQIAALGARIEELKKQVLPLIEQLIKMFEEELKKLMSQLS